MLPTSRDKALTQVLDRLVSLAAQRRRPSRLRIGRRDGSTVEGAVKAISVREVELASQGGAAPCLIPASEIQWIRLATRRWSRLWMWRWELWFDAGPD